MMFMDDAIRATIRIMDAPDEQIKVRSSYNLAAMSFTPQELADSIQEQIPDFEMHYDPDFRQAIADSWPNSIDDAKAKEDWGWEAVYDLKQTTAEMLKNLG